MAFADGIVVEEGLGADASPNANSFGSIAEGDQYFAARNNSDWSGATEAAKAAALVDATDFLEQEYRERWKGIRVSSLQPLSWPRYGVIVEDVRELQNTEYPGSFIGLPNELASSIVPVEVRYATYELALRRIESATTKLLADQDRGGDIKRVKAGSVEVEYGDFRVSGKVYPMVEGLLSPLLRKTLGSSRKLRRS